MSSMHILIPDIHTKQQEKNIYSRDDCFLATDWNWSEQHNLTVVLPNDPSSSFYFFYIGLCLQV